ncbi:DUF2752 domain-containing protein [Sphingobacterium suaedae]|uniref:DUF2752 domain-containing protein n=1 Tax=Sphingobacterium suaedae TaxID=1686402 RepID=UPI0036D3C648
MLLQRRYWPWYLLGGMAMCGVVYIYYTFDPSAHGWFPRCPMKALTGLECPGCGSQRAIHALLHGDVRRAFQHNALLLPFIPYLAIGFAFRFIHEPSPQLLEWRKILFGEYAIKLVGLSILAYFILRNIS